MFAATVTDCGVDRHGTSGPRPDRDCLDAGVLARAAVFRASTPLRGDEGRVYPDGYQAAGLRADALPMTIGRVVAVFGLGGLTGCGGGVSCDEVAQAIALRTWGCTEESDRGFARAKRLRSELGCGSVEQTVTSGTCLVQIGGVSCDEVSAIGDDPDGWFAAAPACGGTFTGGSDTGPTVSSMF